MKKKLEQFKLPVDLAEQLKAYSEASGLDKTEIVILALREQMAAGTKAALSSRLEAVGRLPTNSSAFLELSAQAEKDAISGLAALVSAQKQPPTPTLKPKLPGRNRAAGKKGL